VRLAHSAKSPPSRARDAGLSPVSDGPFSVLSGGADNTRAGWRASGSQQGARPDTTRSEGVVANALGAPARRMVQARRAPRRRFTARPACRSLRAGWGRASVTGGGVARNRPTEEVWRWWRLQGNALLSRQGDKEAGRGRDRHGGRRSGSPGPTGAGRSSFSGFLGLTDVALLILRGRSAHAVSAFRPLPLQHHNIDVRADPGHQRLNDIAQPQQGLLPGPKGRHGDAMGGGALKWKGRIDPRAYDVIDEPPVVTEKAR